MKTLSCLLRRRNRLAKSRSPLAGPETVDVVNGRPEGECRRVWEKNYTSRHYSFRVGSPQSNCLIERVIPPSSLMPKA